MVDKDGNNRGHLDHHGDGPPKEPEEFQDGMAFLFGNFIEAILQPTCFGLGRG